MEIHESHDMAIVPIGVEECSKCWSCVCHEGFKLDIQCVPLEFFEEENNGREEENNGRLG